MGTQLGHDGRATRRHSHPLADLFAVCFIAFTLITLFRAVAGAQQPRPPRTNACIENVQALHRGMMLYVQDYDGRFPLFRRGLDDIRLYTNPASTKTLSCPITRSLYAPNRALRGVSQWEVGNSQHTIPTLQDSRAHLDGKKVVAYLDSHIEFGGVDVRGVDVACYDNIRHSYTAVMSYAQDYDERLPFFDQPAVWKQYLQPYLRGNQLLCPAVNEEYTANAEWARQSLAAVTEPSKEELLFDVTAHPGTGGKTVVFFSGRVENGSKTVTPSGNCVSNLKTLALAMVSYIQDYDERLPTLNSFTRWSDQLKPYAEGYYPLQGDEVFLCPTVKEYYTGNAQWSEVSQAAIPEPAKTPAIYDVTPHPDSGQPTIAYMDGHVGGNPPLATNNPPTVGTTALSNAKAVAFGVMIYVSDYDERFPPMNDYTTFKRLILPYVKGNEQLFYVPYYNKPFILNQELGYRSLASIDSPASTEMFRSPLLPTGRVVGAYSDGHARFTNP